MIPFNRLKYTEIKEGETPVSNIETSDVVPTKNLLVTSENVLVTLTSFAEHLQNDPVGFVSRGVEIWCSDNGGKSWKKNIIVLDVVPEFYNRMSGEIDLDGNDNLYFVTKGDPDLSPRLIIYIFTPDSSRTKWEHKTTYPLIFHKFYHQEGSEPEYIDAVSMSDNFSFFAYTDAIKNNNHCVILNTVERNAVIRYELTLSLLFVNSNGEVTERVTERVEYQYVDDYTWPDNYLYPGKIRPTSKSKFMQGYNYTASYVQHDGVYEDEEYMHMIVRRVGLDRVVTVKSPEVQKTDKENYGEETIFKEEDPGAPWIGWAGPPVWITAKWEMSSQKWDWVTEFHNSHDIYCEGYNTLCVCCVRHKEQSKNTMYFHSIELDKIVSSSANGQTFKTWDFTRASDSEETLQTFRECNIASLLSKNPYVIFSMVVPSSYWDFERKWYILPVSLLTGPEEFDENIVGFGHIKYEGSSHEFLTRELKSLIGNTTFNNSDTLKFLSDNYPIDKLYYVEVGGGALRTGPVSTSGYRR